MQSRFRSVHHSKRRQCVSINSSDKIYIYPDVRPTSVKTDVQKENDDESLTQRIEKIKNNIRKKYRALKNGYIESDELLRVL